MNSASIVASPPMQQAFLWARKGGLAVLDQGLYSGANFLVNILLARWLLPEQYGAFAVAFSVFLLLGAFHASILTEPMLVFGPGKYRARFSEYLGFLLLGHAVIAVVAIIVLGALSWFFSRTSQDLLAEAFAGLAIAAPFILLLWLTRRAFYVHLNPGRAALGSACYLIFVIIGLYLARANGAISPFWSFMIMGFASLAVSLAYIQMLKPRWALGQGSNYQEEMLKAQWSYAKWSSPTAILVWLPRNIYYSILPLLLGLSATGALRAVMNISMPLVLAIYALSGLLVPQFVRSYQSGGRESLIRFGKNAAVILVGGAVLYWILIIVFGETVMQVVYNDNYTKYAHVLPLVGLLPISAAVVVLLGGALRAMEYPQLIFRSYIFASISVVLGTGIIVILGVEGAIIGQLLSLIVAALAMSYYLIRLLR